MKTKEFFVDQFKQSLRNKNRSKLLIRYSERKLLPSDCRFVYMAKISIRMDNESNCWHKIGMAKDPSRRVPVASWEHFSRRCWDQNPCILAAKKFEEAPLIERGIHKYLEEFCHHGEWFFIPTIIECELIKFLS